MQSRRDNWTFQWMGDTLLIEALIFFSYSFLNLCVNFLNVWWPIIARAWSVYFSFSVRWSWFDASTCVVRVACSVPLTHRWHSVSSVCCSWWNIPLAPVLQEHSLFPWPNLVSSNSLTHDFLIQLFVVVQLSSSVLWSPCPYLHSFLPQWFLTERSLSSRTSVCYKILLFIASFLLIPINFCIIFL